MTKTEYAFLLYRAEAIEKQAKKAKEEGAEEFTPNRAFHKLASGIEALVTHGEDTSTLELKSDPRLAGEHYRTALLFYGADPLGSERSVKNGEAHTKYTGPKRRR